MGFELENIETMDLIVFDAVRSTGSMSQGASSLFLSTPSVSARIAGLEEKLEARLFSRGSRGVTLTTAGTAFAGYASRCLELLTESHRAIAKPARRRVTIAAPASIGDYLFGRILFAEESFGLDIHCRIAHSTEVLEGVASKVFSAGIVINRPTPGSLRSWRLGTSSLATVARIGHPLENAQNISLDTLDEYGTVVYRWNADAAGIAQAFEMSRSVASKPVHLVGLPSVAVEMCETTDCVAVVPEYAAARALHDGRLCTLDVTLPRHTLEIDLVYRPEDSDSAWLIEGLTSQSDTLLGAFLAR